MNLAVKLAPTSSRVCEMETNRRSYRRHLHSVKLAKPQIDVTHPPVPRRIQRWDMNSARNRRYQTLLDEQKINLLTDIYIQRVRNSSSFHDTTLLEESDRLIRRSTRSARAMKTRAVRPELNKNMVFKIPKYEAPPEYTYENYDGMVVIDSENYECNAPVREPPYPSERAAPRREVPAESESDMMNRTADEIFPIDEAMLDLTHEEEEDRLKQGSIVSFPI